MYCNEAEVAPPPPAPQTTQQQGLAGKWDMEVLSGPRLSLPQENKTTTTMKAT